MSRSSVISVVVLLACATLAFGCNLRGRRGATCYDAGDCESEAGQLQACVGGYCEDVDCLSSADCSMGEICDVEDFDFDCVEGCNSDTDCLAGSSCSDGQCVTYGCRSTVLDCDLGEFCDADTGECEQAEGGYCSGCNMTDNVWDDGGTLTTCDDYLIGNPFCGGDGNFCLNWYTGTETCFIACETQEDCPGGYQCSQVARSLPAGCSQSYLILGSACINLCEP